MAFYNCNGLTNVMIPDSVTSIGNTAFSNCSNLTSVAILGNVTNDYSSSYGPFYNCTNLESLVLGEKMTKIGRCMFSGCSGLTNVAIPDSVTNIGYRAFYDCSGLATVTIGNGVTNIGNNAFYNCSNLTSVTILGNVTNDYSSSYGPFYNCTNLESLVLGEKMTKIGSCMFSGCSGLTSVTIPDGVTSIGYNAFSGCSRLASMTIPDSVTSIGEHAFSGCSGLTTLVVPESWEGTDMLRDADVPSGCEILYVAYAEMDANGNCTLSQGGVDRTFRVEDGMAVLTALGSANGCVCLPSQIYVLGIGKVSVGRISDGAFASCGNLTAVVLPDSVETVSTGAFSGCASLKRILVPAAWTGTAKMNGVRLPAGCEIACCTHSGTLASPQTWAAGTVHVVIGKLTVPSGVRLIIEAGAVVKFMEGTGLTVASGGASIANGAIFTHIADDTAGGDTLLDGDATHPVAGAYTVTGPIADNEETEWRYTAPVQLSGTVSSSTRWRGHKVYHVTGNLTVSSGAMLTVAPGAIVKFASGCSLTVNSGATLEAQGTRAEPIVFTSVKDDEHGGDTNGDGDATYAQPGDWDEIRNNGGTVALANVTALYGGYGQYSNQGDAVIHTAGGTTTLDCCLVKHSNLRLLGRTDGTVRAENCILADGRWGIDGAVTFINGIIADCNTGANGATLVNTILWACDAYATGGTAANCVAFGGAETAPAGMIYANPLFADPDNGDFRLVSAASPCVDAADTTQAPGTDFYGQERVNARYAPPGIPDTWGHHADIGIHEFLPEGAAGFYDLAAVSVASSATSAAPGGTLSVSWTVRNAGSRTVPDAWHDALALVSVASGKVYPLGEPLNPGVLDAGRSGHTRGLSRCRWRRTAPTACASRSTVAVRKCRKALPRPTTPSCRIAKSRLRLRRRRPASGQAARWRRVPRRRWRSPSRRDRETCSSALRLLRGEARLRRASAWGIFPPMPPAGRLSSFPMARRGSWFRRGRKRCGLSSTTAGRRKRRTPPTSARARFHSLRWTQKRFPQAER
jgi:hypothetical protein